MSAHGEVGRVLLAREQMSPNSGCMAKVGGVSLRSLVEDAYRAVPGAGTAPTSSPEDCAVLGAVEGSLLMTTDFGPLVGPDLYRAGRIAATHALSDVYAMGGTPRAAMVMLVVDAALPALSANAVQAGILAACRAAEVDVVGGHTVEGQEAMAGLSVLGVAGPTLLTKRGARVGDVIALSKPAGTGMIVRGYQQGLLDAPELEEAMLAMERSNRPASQAAIALGAVAATDVTGFGVLGHLAEMLEDGQLGATLELERVPVLSAVGRLPASFARSRYLDENLHYCLSRTKLSGVRDRVALAPLLDPQTSGGLLAVIPPEQAATLDGTGFQAIGRVVGDQRIEIVR